MSCLFESFTKYINFLNKNEDMTATKLRNIICNYLTTNPKMFDDIDIKKIINWDSNLTLEKYIEIMRDEKSWGGGIEIKSFCELTNLNVNVHLPDRRIIEFKSSSPNGLIINISYNGSHYEAL